jgi:RNA-directed DNA polymerase
MLGQGMSGGPLIADDHSVVGIIHKGGPVAYVSDDGIFAPQRQLAVAISELKGWVSSLP